MNVFKSKTEPIESSIIVKYLRRLYEYLGNKYCFLSGAFVIDDSDGILFNILYNSNKEKIGKTLRSHTKYFQGKAGQPNHRNSEFAFYETEFSESIPVSCSCNEKPDEERPVKIIKWFKFMDNDKKFIYMKPEPFPTISGPHLWEAVSRYILKKPNISCRNPRREDCDKEGCIYVNNDNTEFPKNYTQIKYGDNQSEEIEETYNRKGDEVFISSTINKYIIENIESTDNIFNYDDNNIILVNKFGGGKKRTYKRTRKRTRKHTRKHKKVKNIKKSLRKR